MPHSVLSSLEEALVLPMESIMTHHTVCMSSHKVQARHEERFATTPPTEPSHP